MPKYPTLVGWYAVAALAVGCSSPAATPAGGSHVADSAGPADAADTSADTAGTAPDTAADSGPGDAAGSTDVPAVTVFSAVPGARCAPAQRIGLVAVYAQGGGGAALDASATVYDRADPRIPKAAKLSDAVCSYFEQPPIPPCGSCGPGKLCDPSGQCTAMPVAAADVKLVLKAGGGEQTFVAKDGNGAYGSITLAGKSFSLAVQWSGLTVTLGETAVPPALGQVTGKLAGGYDKPSGLDLAWVPPKDAAMLFTHIPINHHAGGQTFTECQVAASAGPLHIDGAMLLPLSVSTGLEFQGIEHVRFAAAETPLGCVEVRMQTSQFVDMTR